MSVVTSRSPTPTVPVARPSGRSRISALDTARGLAVIGMISVHTLDFPELTWSDPAHWYGITQGRSSILFAVLGGASLALMTGRTRPPTGPDLLTARLRVIVRAVLLFALGGLLMATTTSVAVILEYYAVLFVLAVPFLTWRPRRLIMAAIAWAVVMPTLVWAIAGVLPAETLSTGGIVELAFTGTYPAFLWVSFLLLGLAIGRSDLSAMRTRRLLLGWGSLAAFLGYSIAWVATYFWGPTAEQWQRFDAAATDQGAARPQLGFNFLLNAEPHSGTTFEIIGSAGVAAAIIGLLLHLPPMLTRILAPLTAIGLIPLSIYTGHVVSLAIWDPEMGTPNFFFASIGVAVIAAWVWTRHFGRGPMERLMTRITNAAVRVP
ncbi:DUF1624 domain-containing protein [Nocardia panacis]|uniref:DUF1624 domain-containing protein n=1 Tax=Nocardia panacis TaxID=2340916 RepID=A0A3A4KM45_9NOCA|nr:heparan-alpha-glucosaminide N-acetyltransferase domain-containing protein [Nocardia panacis]RJO76628.1 DUF1624 domain-containing protein [Nocardia panacis]